MHKGHPRVPDARPRTLVDQPQAGLAQRRQRGLDVADLVGHVVQPGTARAQEAAHRAVLLERGDQLDVALPDVEQDRLDALLGDDLAVGHLELEAVAPEGQRGLDLLDGHSHVVDAPEH